MNIVKNSNAKRIVESFVSKQILDAKPVIAGGFITSIYYYAIRHSNSMFDEYIRARLDSLEAIKGMIRKEDIMRESGFGDIDCWFLQDNPFCMSDAGKILLSDFKEDELDLSFFGMMYHKKKFNNLTPSCKETLKEYGLVEKVFNSTYWANTYSMVGSGIPLQMIKHHDKSVDDLFSRFDMVNCCAAYYDGKFYFSDEFERASNNFNVELSDNFKREHGLSKMWTVLRGFKYAERHSLGFSDELISMALESFIYSESILKDIDEGLFNLESKSIDLGVIPDVEDPYGLGGHISIISIKGMIGRLHRYFIFMAKMKNFDERDLFLFLDSRNDKIMSYIKGFLDSQ